MPLAFAVTLLMWVLNLRSEVRVRLRYLTESVLSRGWSCSLYDLLIIVLLLLALMVKHLSALSCISQEPTESRSDLRSSVSFCS